MGGVPGFLTVKPDTTGPRLVVSLETKGAKGLEQAVERIRRIFDLGADPVQIASHLSRDPDSLWCKSRYLPERMERYPQE
jgi:hypothetical protein